MKKSIIFTITALLGLLFTGCELGKSTKSAERTAFEQTEQAMEEAQRQTGMPAIVNFKEKKALKMLYELRDQEGLVCHAYLVNVMTGQIGQYLGPCMGYGMPYSTQYSNPQRLVDVEKFGIESYQANDSAVIPQPEPNGLFMPDGLSATWLMMIDPANGEVRPVYVEPTIIVSPFKLH